jgi:hypothetical protein
MTPIDQGKARVRELCRQLKPIIGAQADRIWLAFVTENEAGKEQILDYLELLAAQHFQRELENEGPGLIPPKAADAAGEYVLGQVAYNERDLYPFGLRESEWCQHVGCFGRSGAGKTNLGFLIIQELVRAGKPVLIFDWKRNYRDLLSLPGFDQMAVYTIGRPASPLSFNPLVPPAGTNPQTWLKKLIAVIAHAYLLGDGVIYLLQEAIDQVYHEFGVYDGHIDRWPTFQDVFQVLKRRPTTGREAGWMSSALRALASLCFGDMDVLVNQGNDDLRDLLTRPVILELDALTQSDKVFVAEAILLYIHHLRLAEPTREQFRHCIVLEEAHHLLSDQRQSLVGGQSVMEITFREIRELGEACLVLDQAPSQISASALGNTYCTICFNLKHRTDVSAMSQAMLLQDDEKNILGNLQVGQAVVRLQGRAVRPFMISVPEFIIRKGTVTDMDVIEHMTELGLLSARNVQIQPAPPLAYIPQEGSSASNARQVAGPPDPRAAFLDDVDRYPDSGIALRYRRLGLSVRQGQKIKNELIAAGWVTEEVQTTHQGRVRTIRLTEQGRLSVQERFRSDSESEV